MATESKLEAAEEEEYELKRLVANHTLGDLPAEVFVVRYSDDGTMLAAGLANGSIRVVNLKTGHVHIVDHGSVLAMPCTSLRFRPLSATSKTKNVLLAVDAQGVAKHWHVKSGKCLHRIEAEGENQLFAVDYRDDGSMFATAGSDKKIRLYDEATKSLVSELEGGIPHLAVGHSNRVFSLKFAPHERNTLLSGGWDGTVHVWDVRAGESVRHIVGPYLAGDAMDICRGVILTGSSRAAENLQTWDLGTGKLIETIDWNPSGQKSTAQCKLYTAQFSPDGRFIGAGGYQDNMAKVFDRRNENQLVGTLAGLTQGIFSMHFAPQDHVAIAGGDAAVRIFDILDRGHFHKGPTNLDLKHAPVAASESKLDSESKGE